MPDEKKEIISLNEGVFAGLSIQEIEARLEMTVLEVISGLVAQCNGCYQCTGQANCGSCNVCSGYSRILQE